MAYGRPEQKRKLRLSHVPLQSLTRLYRIMADLDNTAQKLLNKDPNNPNSPKKADPPRPGLGMSKSTMSSKPSLREAMLAQKRAALTTKNTLPARPGSAMAQLSPVRTKTTTATSAAERHTEQRPAVRGRPESSLSVKAGGMSVAPMRPARRRPEVAARPATAGPYSVRDQPASMEAESPETLKSKGVATLRTKETTPRRTAPRPRPGHASHASESSVPSPSKSTGAKVVASPRGSPAKLKQSHTAQPLSSPPKARVEEEAELVVPRMEALNLSPTEEPADPAPEPVSESPRSEQAVDQVPVMEPPIPSPQLVVPEIHLEDQPEEPKLVKSLEVYEDPFTAAQPSPPKPLSTSRILEDRPVNEDAANLQKPTVADVQAGHEVPAEEVAPQSPEKARQNLRLLDSGITKIKAKTLEVHGFRKLQSLLRDSRTTFADDKFEALLLGLFQYLEDPLSETAPEKVQDVKAQILATIKLLLKTQRDNFQPHVSKGLESLLQTRSAYDGRSHIVSGIELLASELVSIGDASEILVVLARRLETCTDSTTEGCRSLGMGLHVLKEMIERRPTFCPSDTELDQLARLAGRCLDSADSGVRMGAVQLCVALHSRVGEGPFWEAVKGVKDDPKSLITYYIVKRQREQGVTGTPAAA